MTSSITLGMVVSESSIIIKGGKKFLSFIFPNAKNAHFKGSNPN